MSHLGSLISALIDGELGGVELDRANAHLAGCAACQSEAAQLRELKRELRTLGDLDGEAAITSRLLAMVGPGCPGVPGAPGAPAGLVTARPLERRPGRRARRRRGRYAMWGAMSLVVVGVGAAAFGMGGSPSGNEPQIPFADPASTRPKGSAKAIVKGPVSESLLRAAAEATRP